MVLEEQLVVPEGFWMVVNGSGVVMCGSGGVADDCRWLGVSYVGFLRGF